MPAPLLPKYLRLRRESQSAELPWDHRQRLARELAQLECTFVEMGLMPFADTQPCEHFNLDGETSTASTPTVSPNLLVGLASPMASAQPMANGDAAAPLQLLLRTRECRGPS